MTGVETADPIDRDLDLPGSTPPRRRLSRRMVVVLVVTLVVAGGAGAGVDAWVRGGTFLRAGGAGYGAPVPTGEVTSFGIGLSTVSGPSVVLDRASASASPRAGATLTFSIYRTPPGGIGFGSWDGPLAPTFPTRPVHGYRVAQPDRRPQLGATWLVATVTATRPGVYRYDDFAITYHSGPRTRRTRAPLTSLCVLAYPKERKQRILQQIAAFVPGETSLAAVDPLVAAYETCDDPTLGT